MSHKNSEKLSSRRPLAALATVALLSLLSWVAAAGPPPPGAVAIRPLDKAEARSVSYRSQIQPLLASRCGQCHSGAVPSGGLSVMSLAALLRGGEHGLDVVVGKPDESALIQYVRGLKTPRMPMSGPALSVDEVHLLREWVFAGARDDLTASGPSVLKAHPLTQFPIEDESGLSLAELRVKHLARLPRPAAVPTVSAPAFNEIDRFIAAKWREKKFPTPPVCDDTAFVRRAYLDVVGVIPTAAQALSFVQDKTPGKRVRLVDELLARDEMANNVSILAVRNKALRRFFVFRVKARSAGDDFLFIAEHRYSTGEVARLNHCLHLGFCPLAHLLDVHPIHKLCHLLTDIATDIIRELLFNHLHLDTYFFEQVFRHFERVPTPQPAHVGADHDIEASCFGIGQQLLEVRALQRGSGDTLISVGSDEHAAFVLHILSV